VQNAGGGILVGNRSELPSHRIPKLIDVCEKTCTCEGIEEGIHTGKRHVLPITPHLIFPSRVMNMEDSKFKALTKKPSLSG